MNTWNRRHLIDDIPMIDGECLYFSIWVYHGVIKSNDQVRTYEVFVEEVSWENTRYVYSNTREKKRICCVHELDIFGF